MEFEMPKSKVYIQTDPQSRITRCDGGYTTPSDLTGWTKIDEGTPCDRLNLAQSHYFDGGLYTMDGIPRYKYADGKCSLRTDKEIEADRNQPLVEVQVRRIAESKTALSEYLESRPLTWTDGKQYSVTAEKQSLLTGNLSAYSIATQLGVTPNPLMWNTTGSECTEWTFADLGALALAIQAYVKPFVAYQQSKEVEIKACATVESVEAVVIDYDSVKG